MSVALLREYIMEVMMTQNVVRKDPEGSGKLVIRKLVTYKKPASRYAPGEDVDTEFDKEGNCVVDDLEKWEPDYEKSARRPTRRRHRKTHHLA